MNYPLDPKTAPLPPFGPNQVAYLKCFFHNDERLVGEFTRKLQDAYRCDGMPPIENEARYERFVQGWKIFRAGAIFGQTITLDMAQKEFLTAIIFTEVEQQVKRFEEGEQRYGVN